MIFVRVILLLLVAGIQSQARHYTVAIIPRQTQSLFWKGFKAGAEQAAEEFKASGKNSATVLWRGPLHEDDWAPQAVNLDGFSARRVDAILLAPVVEKELKEPLDAVAATGVPVVVVDSNLSHTGVVAHVEMDHAAAGKAAAKELAQAINGRGRVAFLRFSTNNPATLAREAGFREGLRAHPDIQLVQFEDVAGPSRKSARETALKWLANPESKLDGVFCPNEPTAEGMLDALRSKPSASCRMVCCDLTKEVAKGIVEGTVTAAVVEDAKAYGKAALEAALAVAQKQPAPGAPTFTLKVVNLENVKQEEWLQ